MLFKTYHAIIILIIAFFISPELIAQTVSKNIEIMDSLFSQSASVVVADLKDNNLESIYLFINPSETDWMIKEKMLDKSKSSNIKFYNKKDSSAGQLEIWIRKIKVDYKNVADEYDLLQRKIEFKLSYAITNRSGEVSNLKEQVYNYNDTINRIEIGRIESKGLAFTQSEIPEPPSSFLEEIAEPLIVISSAAAAVILLFVVRSK